MLIHSDNMEKPMQSNRNGSRMKALRFGIAFLCGVVFSAFLPIYEYSTMKHGEDVYPVRTHKLTGRAEYYAVGWSETNPGWVAELVDRFSFKAQEPESPAVPREFSSQELAKLSGTLSIEYGNLVLELHNGTKRSIQKITIAVLVIDAKGKERIERKYELWAYNGADPLKVTAFRTQAGFDVAKGETWQWAIVSAAASY